MVKLAVVRLCRYKLSGLIYERGLDSESEELPTLPATISRCAGISNVQANLPTTAAIR